MSSKIVNYKTQAKKMNASERERILSRMSGKLPKRLANDKLTETEAIAIQLELEDEQLAEWREKVSKIRNKDSKKNSKK